ncbi:hypothetical protein B0H13DRAFT_2304194 [Mycena leptocephala]|nr:hypothetical protein B0H13DRAFT_2304194 [Mycena leptocephala]
MDPNNPPFAVDASVIAVNESYDNLVTSSGYPPDSVTSSGYPPDSVTSSDYHNNAYVQNSVPASSSPYKPEKTRFCWERYRRRNAFLLGNLLWVFLGPCLPIPPLLRHPPHHMA